MPAAVRRTAAARGSGCAAGARRSAPRSARSASASATRRTPTSAATGRRGCARASRGRSPSSSRAVSSTAMPIARQTRKLRTHPWCAATMTRRKGQESRPAAGSRSAAAAQTATEPSAALSWDVRADVAQLVEHFTRNEGVRGSNPRVGSPHTIAQEPTFDDPCEVASSRESRSAARHTRIRTDGAGAPGSSRGARASSEIPTRHNDA